MPGQLSSAISLLPDHCSNMSRETPRGRRDAFWKCSCNAAGKNWSASGFRLANCHQASGAAVFLVLEIPLTRHRVVRKGIGDEQIS